MSGLESFLLIMISLHILILIYVIVRSVRLINTEGMSPEVLFFIFSMTGFMVSGLYWMAYIYLRPDTRMPFAVNEVGEWAGFLLLAASINAVFINNKVKAIKEIICTVIFTLVCTAFWIAWSGEWLQDIISGIVCGYFFCIVIRALYVTNALGKKGFAVLGIMSAVLLVCQGLTFIVPESFSMIPDVICYVLMFTGIALFYSRLIYSWVKKYEPEKLFALSTGCFAWGVNCMYMSAEPMYDVMELFEIAAFVLMMVSLRKVVRHR